MATFLILLLLPIICLLVLAGIAVILWRSFRRPSHTKAKRVVAVAGAVIIGVPALFCLLWSLHTHLFWYSWAKSLEDSRMIEQTKKEAQPAIVKKAALPLFSLADTNLTSTNLPKEITSLPLFSGDPRDIDCWHITTNALMFSTGGGFGHWGLIICQGKPQLEDTQGLHAVVTPLSDGVFIWEEL